MIGGAVVALGAWGMKPPVSKTGTAASSVYTLQTKPGEKVFKKYCASCHQLDGGGVPHLAPPLIGTRYVLGDKPQLIHIVLHGFNEDVEIEGDHFSNPMPPFNKLSDKDIASVLTYVRSSFGNHATSISAADVKAVRTSGK